MTVELEDIQAAQRRLQGRVRRTPLLAATQAKQPLGEGELFLKLESLQVTGSFKARGATNALLSLSDAEIQRGICCASGGNHGLAVAFAGWSAKTRAVVYLPHSTPEEKARAIAGWGAEVVIEGEVFDDADKAARAFSEAKGLTYLPAFSDPRIVAGQGTVGLEILEDLGPVDTLLVAIGGGGLIAGIGRALKALRPEIRIIGVEPTGAPTLKRSVEAGELVTLERIETKAGTLAPRRSAELNFEIIRETVDDIVLVSDEEMLAAARWLWKEFGIGAELSGAAALAALQSGRVGLAKGESVCALVCGAGKDGVS
jgi:threonine dehydratase